MRSPGEFLSGELLKVNIPADIQQNTCQNSGRCQVLFKALLMNVRLWGFLAMGAFYCLEACLSQWRLLDNLGTHLPYSLMQLFNCSWKLILIAEIWIVRKYTDVGMCALRMCV